ncbi:MAG: PQQ-binding-like beta-propeller repeat protein [Treponema sp.]|jgi:outer membrane protein assembly factor BamB|nr:PQQ-binding-like beta-propeller repeat protein [Treponema sp.]
MCSILKKIVLLAFAAFPAFSQSGAVLRGQGLYTGESFWRQALGGAVLSLPSVQAQSAVVALDGGNIRAYSTDGHPLWNYSARGRISPFVTRSREGTSYLSRTNGALIAVNRAGRELWRRTLDDPLAARVVVGWDGRLFAPAGNKIYCLTASGSLLWTKTFNSPFSLAPVLDRGGGIIFALENNEAYRIDPYGNALIWPLSKKPAALLSLEQQEVMAIYVDGAMEILGEAEEWYVSAQSVVQSLSVLPRLPAGSIAAAGRGNNVAALLSDGRVALVSMDERRILWSVDSHVAEFSRNGGRPDTEAEMIYDERGIYVLSKDGATCFSHDGRRLWFTFLQNAAAIPAFGDDGVLYLGGRDWILYAYKIEDRAVTNNPYGPDSEGSYGTGVPQPLWTPNIPFFEYEVRNKLEQITSAVNSGRVGGNEPEWTTFLLTVSAGRDQIQFRLSALYLLGRIGSRETIPWLINIFRRDNEPLVKVAAAAAVGAIGVDPDGAAIQAFQYSIIQPGGTRDEQILTAIASATGALCRFSGPPLSETGVRILNLLSSSSQPPAVRRQAGIELASLL